MRSRCSAMLAVAVALVAVTASSALAHPRDGNQLNARGSFARLVPPTGLFPNSTLAESASLKTRRTAGAEDVAPDAGRQHEDDVGHLPPSRSNVELVSKLETAGEFGDVVEGQIADLSVHEGFAYLNSWAEETCRRGGIYIVDIRDPRAPREVGFLPALRGNYHGEGAHAIEVDTPSFKGDLLAVNNEYCAAVRRGGGFDLYDVSDPANPRVLVQGFGDFGPEGSLVGDPSTRGANSSHSTFMWEDERSGRVYLVAQDNTEFHDVDIFDITNPRSPQPVAEHDLVELFPQIVDGSALNDEIFHHDVVVKSIGGTPTMMASYWDGGYVKMDVSNPAEPVYLGDTSFDGADPLFPQFDPPEGNAHQSEFSADNRFVLAADEDFSPYRTANIVIEGGSGAGTLAASSVSDGAPVAALPDRRLNGPTVYGGYGCPGSAPVPQRSTAVGALPEGQEAILVVQRGPVDDASAPEEPCFPGEKAAVAQAAGWDAVVIANRHLGDAASDEAYCGAGGYPPGLEYVTVCTTHEAVHRMFGDSPEFGTPQSQSDLPPIGTAGAPVSATAVFDGWGYAQLYRNSGTKLRRVDSYSVAQARDERFATGFGDLSIHEFATDASASRAYVSYYAAGVRVMTFGNNGLRDAGHFIDEGGNNFWGIEAIPGRSGMFAASDRDFGLYVFRYTGR